MATTYQDRIDEVIWALRCSKLTGAEIMRRLENNEAGLGKPITMHRTTLYRRLQKMERAHKVIDVDNVATEEALSVMARSIIEDTLKDVARRRKRGPLCVDDIRFLKMVNDGNAFSRAPRGPASSRAKGQPQRSGVIADLEREMAKDDAASTEPVPTNGLAETTASGNGEARNVEGEGDMRPRSGEEARASSSDSSTPATSPSHA